MDRLKEFLALIESDLSDRLTPTPSFTFDEWAEIAKELRTLTEIGLK